MAIPPTALVMAVPRRLSSGFCEGLNPSLTNPPPPTGGFQPAAPRVEWNALPGGIETGCRAPLMTLTRHDRSATDVRAKDNKLCTDRRRRYLFGTFEEAQCGRSIRWKGHRLHRVLLVSSRDWIFLSADFCHVYLGIGMLIDNLTGKGATTNRVSIVRT